MAKKIAGLPDALAATRVALGALDNVLKEGSMDREVVLGLRFRKGDKVRDKVTGERGTVEAGTRKAVTVSHAGEEGR